jgi:RecA-family ATPase
MISIARNYIARGWSPVPIPHRSKGPIIDEWQHLRITTETAPSYFNGAPQNIGIILGKASGGLTDLDLDCPEAGAAAPYVLPGTAVFGHASKPGSHWIYRTNLGETQDRAAIKFTGSDKSGLLEVRLGGGGMAAQTVFPPSTHVSGEPIEWTERGASNIAVVDSDELLQRARRLAAAAELARNFPRVGARHDAAFVLGGFLARCGWSPAEAAVFVEAVAVASGQPNDKRKDMVRTARNGAEAEKRAGFPAMVETFGEGPAKKVADWLDYRGERGNGAEAPDDEPGGSDAPPPRIICPTIFIGRTPPPRRWIVPQWVPNGVVTGLYGDGGVGKTLLAQQLQTGTALGSAWLGLAVEQVASLGVYCEDGEDELWRRQCDINVAYAVDHDALALKHWMPRLGEDNILMSFGRNGVGQLTTFHRQVGEAALDLKCRLVIIDTAADSFGGNENDRGQVRQYVQRALGAIALKIEGSVVCCAHPSRTGLSSGSGDSGSTGWSNAFRSRAYLNRPEAEDGENVDTNARIITRKKANFAGIGETIKLHWRDGVIVPDQLSTSSYFRRSAEDVFLTLLDAMTAEGQKVSPKSRASNYAPAIFLQRPKADRSDYQRADFERAMQALLKNGKIKIVPYGPKSWTY